MHLRMKRYVDTSKKNCQASAKAIELMKTEEGSSMLTLGAEGFNKHVDC